MDAVIIGTGRVGLPLALSLFKNGIKTCGIDINKDTIEKVNNKEMPFWEDGYDEILKEVEFKIYEDYTIIKKVRNIIITVGTPLLQHIEIDLEYICDVFDKIIPSIKKGHNIILRSTVAPETTLFLKKKLEKETSFVVGEDIFLSFCPERIAEGKALKELEELPQIIGVEDDKSFEMAKDIFKVLTKKIIQVSYSEAELIKLFCNISRYLQFSVINYLALIANQFNCDIHKLIKIINIDYPRPVIGQVGLTAGTCLRKDWGLINESIPFTDMLLTAYKVNEYMPKHLIEIAKGKINNFTNCEVGVLGYSFKKDCDDVRDSLTPKFLRYLEREVPKEIYVNEPNVDFSKYNEIKYKNNSLMEFIGQVDVVFILINHEIYKKHFSTIYTKAKTGCVFVDIWNISDKNEMIFIKE